MNLSWNKFSDLTRYYLISIFSFLILWTVLALFNVEFINVVFFITAFVWHFALLTPGLKEKILLGHHKFSFLAVVMRVNHYLQIFINIKGFPFMPSLIRALSPALFTLTLLVVGGSGNILFTFLGSFFFEVIYLAVKMKTSLLKHRDDREIPPVIPSEEKNRV